MSISGISGSPYALGALRSMDGTMPVSSIDDDENASAVGATRPKQDDFRSDFASLLQAVKGGDLNAAQTALGTLQSDLNASTAGYSRDSTSASAQSSSASPAQNDLDALFKAVKSGDISGAQTSLAQLQSDTTPPSGASSGSQASATGGAHRHHGHHGGGLEAAVAAAFSATAGTSSDAVSATSDTSTVSGTSV